MDLSGTALTASTCGRLCFYNLSRRYGEQNALEYMQRTFGEENPKKGMALAMGTHSLYPDVWLINGVTRLDEIKQMSLVLQLH
jgi:hypothetical protein